MTKPLPIFYLTCDRCGTHWKVKRLGMRELPCPLCAGQVFSFGRKKERV